MISIHWINETLAWLDNDDQKIKFLDNVQTDILNVLSEKPQDNEVYKYATEKARKILHIKQK